MQGGGRLVQRCGQEIVVPSSVAIFQKQATKSKKISHKNVKPYHPLDLDALVFLFDQRCPILK